MFATARLVFLARLITLVFAALLSACSNHAPSLAPHSVVAPQRFSPASDDVLFRALGLVGTPYRYGGNTPESGFDCSGLIGYVYQDAAGIRLPRTTGALQGMAVPPVARQALQSGDLVFFATDGGGKVSHAGIYVGNGRFVHAPSSGGTVRLDSLSNNYWRSRYLNARRVLDSEQLARNP